jgi:GAF domain-containing protein
VNTEHLGLLPATPEAEALDQIVEVGVRAVQADAGSLLVMEHDTGGLRFVTTFTLDGSDVELAGHHVPLDSGIIGLAAVTRHVQVGAPVFHDAAQTERLSEGAESVIAAPMLLGEELIGVLTATTFAKGRLFTAQEADLLARFARLASLLVEQTRLLRAKDEASQPDHLHGLGHAGRLEHEILERLRRIVAESPHALAPLARIAEGIEQLAARRPL